MAAATFAGLGLGCYALYGQPFLQEAYLYHGSRRDPRHNFAPYFYPTYLDLGAKQPSDALSRSDWPPFAEAVWGCPLVLSGLSMTRTWLWLLNCTQGPGST